MSDVIIRVEKLSKRYRIGERVRYLALRDVLSDVLCAPFRRLSSFVQWPSTDGEEQRPTTDE